MFVLSGNSSTFLSLPSSIPLWCSLVRRCSRLMSQMGYLRCPSSWPTSRATEPGQLQTRTGTRVDRKSYRLHHSGDRDGLRECESARAVSPGSDAGPNPPSATSRLPSKNIIEITTYADTDEGKSIEDKILKQIVPAIRGNPAVDEIQCVEKYGC